jgi:hypothetical protein
MSSGLMVLANHNIDAQEILELGNKVENKISGFSLVNREQLKELILLEYDDYYEYQYGDVNENVRIEAKIIKMSRDPKDNKIKFEKEFTTEQEMKQLRIASKEFAKIEKDRIINDTGFECNYWQCGDKMVGVYVTGMGLLFDIDYNIIIFNSCFFN